MKVLVNEIPPEGLNLTGELDAAGLDLNTQHINFGSPIKVDCFITKIKNDLFANCRLSARTRQVCSRCLKDFELEIEKNIELHYQLKGELAIVLDGNIKDEIMVDYPIKILCRQDCRGLCQRCGRDLNEGPCGCNKANIQDA